MTLPNPSDYGPRPIDRQLTVRQRLLPAPSCPLPPGYFDAIIAAGGSGKPPTPTGWRRLWQQLRRWLLKVGPRRRPPPTGKPRRWVSDGR